MQSELSNMRVPRSMHLIDECTIHVGTQSFHLIAEQYFRKTNPALDE
jgi:hypothetical protein